MDLHHEVAPQPGGQSAAGHVPHRAVIVISDPDTGGVVCGVADEPGVPEGLAGTGLAGRGPAGQGGAAPRPRQDDILQHGRHGPGVFGVEGPFGAGIAVLVEHIAAGIGDREDEVGRPAFPVIGEDGIGGGQFQQVHLCGAQGDRRQFRQVGADAEPVAHLDDAADADLAGDLHGDGVDRALERLLQGDQTPIAAGKVLRRPAFQIDRFVPDRR